ncbi:hypothetical protein J2X31_002351 [Flavobacterium arsenatis]|uniref:Uncharacterized protein n=1 Tax=Flavobacterium arsenatis TaxID=1484332 RepID=A0ABU1TQS0_9FLAO|nr:hypothetical protein [Flavobacterium arsenatis]
MCILKRIILAKLPVNKIIVMKSDLKKLTTFAKQPQIL